MTNFTNYCHTAISKMGFNKFVTVAGGTIVGGLMTGLLLYNAIPDSPQIIETVTENIIEKENV